ncbi:MAG: hypothetical protein Q8P16_01425 [bacterium]|nr:hypothetical protein [bacterium]
MNIEPTPRTHVIVTVAALLAIAVLVAVGGEAKPSLEGTNPEELQQTVLPASGVTLPIVWGDYGMQMTDAGVIDKDKFEQIYASRGLSAAQGTAQAGGLTEVGRALLYENDNTSVRMTPENADELLNILWAFGLANKSPILEEGAMMTYDGVVPTTRAEGLAKASRMASTGGWTISKGDAMNHYSAHEFVVLTDDEWAKVDRVAANIYRPCCGNATNFPDCNHGLAMLGLLELLAANNVPEEEMYEVALAVNAYWFPSTYLTIAKLFALEGTSWEDVNPKVALGYDYSSAEGFSNVLSRIDPEYGQGGGSCSI